jgi:hypothetical protein
MNGRKQIYLGIGIGLLTAFLISFVVFLTSNPGFTAADYFNIYVNGKLLAPILSVALLGNLGLFFLFIKLDRDLISKGILAATMICGLLIFILKFFT